MVAGRPLYAQSEENTVMRMVWMCNAILGLLVCVSSAALAEDQGTKPSIEKKLTSEYALTKTTDDKTDIVTAGAVLVLQKDKLYMAPTDATGNPCQNNYKDGKLSQSGAGKDKGIYLEFFTDAINDVRYKGTLMIQVKALPSPEDALKLVAEVITVAPSEEAKDDKEKPA